MTMPDDKNGVVFELLKDSIERLIKSGANVIGVACNTIHFLFAKLPSYDAKILDILDCAVEKV